MGIRQVDGTPAGVVGTHRPAFFDGTGYRGCYSVGSTYSAPAVLLTSDQVFTTTGTISTRTSTASNNLSGGGGGNNSNRAAAAGVSNASLLTSESGNTGVGDSTGTNNTSFNNNSNNNNNNSPSDLPGSSMGTASPMVGSYCAHAHTTDPNGGGGGSATGGFLNSIAAAAVGAARCASAGFVTVSSVTLPGAGVQEVGVGTGAGIGSGGGQMQPSQQQVQQTNWEQHLCTDLLWLTNQVMAALVTAGPLLDCLKETTGCDQHQPTEPVPDPGAGYVMRWLSGLLVARTSVLSAVPWLWHCPVLELLHSVQSDSRQTKQLAGGRGGGLVFPRAGVSAGGRRLDSLLHQLGEETLVLLLDTNRSSPFLMNWIINQCYVAENTVLATSCFTALCRLFTAVPDFSCDFITLITLAMVYVQHPQLLLSKRALYLLRVLYYRFIIMPMTLVHHKWHQTVDSGGEPGDNSKPNDSATKLESPPAPAGEETIRSVGNEKRGDDDNDHLVSESEALLTCSSSRAGTPVCAQFRAGLTFWRCFSLLSPQEVLRQFAAQHPDYTLHIFSEICLRLETARECLKEPLLCLFRPWIVNIELVDLIDQNTPHPARGKPASHAYDAVDEDDGDSSESDADDEVEDAVSADFCHVPAEDCVAFDGASDDSDSTAAGVPRWEREIPVADSFQAGRPRPSSFVLPSSSSVRATGGASEGVQPTTTREQILSARKAETMPSPSIDRLDIFKQHRCTPRVGLARPVRSAHSSSSYRALHLPLVDVEAEVLMTIPPTLRSTGWGSKQATELVLTNLYFLTLLFSECPTTTEGIKQVWTTLIRHRRDNLLVVLRYLIVITSLAPATLLPHSKRLITYLAEEKAESVIEELMAEMQTIDGVGMSIERTDSMPYFRITTAVHHSSTRKPASTGNPTTTTLSRHEHQSGRPGHHHAGEQQHTAADLMNKCSELLKLVNRDNLRRPDPEVEALCHATSRAGAGRRTSLQGCCQVESPDGGASGHKRASLQRGVSRPKSVTNQPSNTIGDSPAVSLAHRCLSTSMTTTECAHANSSRTGVDCRALNLVRQSYCDVLFESDSDADVDTAMPRHQKLSPDDKYATLKPKDLNRLLGNADAVAAPEDEEEKLAVVDREEESECQCSETVSSTSTTSMSTPSTTVSDGHARPHSRTAVQLRSGTLPSTTDSRARYFICSQCFPSTPGSRKHRIGNRSSPPTAYAGTGHRDIALHHQRRALPSRLHRPLRTVPQQTVSLPPSLACLTPLPLSLPIGVPSMPSLMVSSLADKLTQKSSSVRHSATGSPVQQPTATDAGDMGSLLTSAVNSLDKTQLLILPSTDTVCYQAPLNAWLTEPLVIGGPVVYSGSWPASGARSPLVLLLTGGLIQCAGLKVDWTRHLPVMLLSVLLGIDHCRSLVQEECKQLLVSLLRLACPHQDSLVLLSLQLETDLSLVAYPSAMPSARHAYYNLMLDGGPFQENFDLLIPGRVGIPEEASRSLLEEHESSFSPPPLLTTGRLPYECSSSSFTSPRKPVKRHPPSQRLRRSYPPRWGGTAVSNSSPSTSPHDPDAEPSLVMAVDRQRCGQGGHTGSSPAFYSVASRSDAVAEHCPVWASSTFSLLSTATLVPDQDPGLPDTDCTNKSSPVVPGSSAGQQAAAACRPTNPIAQGVNRQSPLRVRSPRCGHVSGGLLLANHHQVEHGECSMPNQLHTGTATKGRTSYEVVNSRQLHTAIEELRGVLLSSSGQAVWTWEDFRLLHFQQTSINYLMHQNHPDSCVKCSRCCVSDAANQGRPGGQTSPADLCSQSKPLIVRLVQLIARILSLSEVSIDEAEEYLQCHHNTLSPETVGADDRPIGVLHPVASSPGLRPVVPMVARLSEVALSTGLSCPNRHYASRSLQIFRILGANLDTKSLSRVLARLGETVADTNEEIQGYVAELLLTQEAAVRHLRHKSDTVGQLSPAYGDRCGQVRTAPNSPSSAAGGHLIEKKCAAMEPPAVAVASGVNADGGNANSEFTRCQSMSSTERRRLQHRSLSARIAVCAADTVRGCALASGDIAAPSSSSTTAASAAVGQTPAGQVDQTGQVGARPPSPKRLAPLCCRLPAQERADLVCGVFWTGVFLLQSDFEHEYLFGLRLLDALLPSVCACQSTAATGAAREPMQSACICLPDLCARAQSTLSQMRLSPPFPGILPLAIKGCSSLYLVDSSCRLLVNLIPFMSCPLVMPRNRCPEELTFALLLLTLLPMLLTAWDEDPTATPVPRATVPGGGTSEAPLGGDLQQQQTSLLQGGGFLGRSVSGMPAKFPRALGSWTTLPYYTASASSLPGQLAQPQVSQQHGSRLHRMDSMSFPSNCIGGDFRVAAGGNVPSVQQQAYSYSSGVNTGYHHGGGAFPLKPKNPVCIKAAESLAQVALRINSVLLTNLALILRLYATGCFSKDADQWAKCVVSYLLEGCGQYAAQLVRYLTTLITYGPACLQMPLLKIACLVLENVDFQDTEVADALNNFITSTSTQFLGTDLWPMTTRLAHIVMSRCAVLVSPELCPTSPPSKYTCVDLNALAVAVPLPESEPPSRELAGPVVDVAFDVLREVPLLAASYVVEPFERMVPTLELGHSQQSTRPEGLTPLISPLGQLFLEVATVGWNKPGAFQSQVRDRLYRLVGCYGLPTDHRLYVPRSPSVIFSQSTETLDPQLSVHSSSETASVIDTGNSDDFCMGETSSMDQAAVFHDLDTYLDAQLMNINFLGLPDCRLSCTSASTSEDEPRRPWGVRGQSITCHTEFTDSEQRTAGGGGGHASARDQHVPLVHTVLEEVGETTTDDVTHAQRQAVVVGVDPNLFHSYTASSSTSCCSPPLVHMSPSLSERSVSLSAQVQSSGTEWKPRSSDRQDACILISVKRKPLTSSKTDDNICQLLHSGSTERETRFSESPKLRARSRVPSFGYNRSTEVSPVLVHPKKSTLRTLRKLSPVATVERGASVEVQPASCRQLSPQRCRSATSLAMECSSDKSGDELVPSVTDRVVSVRGVRLHQVVDRRRNVLGKHLRRHAGSDKHMDRESVSFEDFSKVDQPQSNLCGPYTPPEVILPTHLERRNVGKLSLPCPMTADRVILTFAGDFSSPVDSVVHCNQCLTVETNNEHGCSDAAASGVTDSSKPWDVDDDCPASIGHLALSSLERDWLRPLCVCDSGQLERTSICDLPRLFASLSARCLAGVRAAANLCGFTWADTTVGSDFRQLLNIGQRIYGHLRPPFIDFSQASLEQVAVYVRPKLLSLYEVYSAVQDVLCQLSKVELHTSTQTEQQLVQLSTILLLRLVDFLHQCHVTVQETADRMLATSESSAAAASWLNSLLTSIVQLAVDVSCELDHFRPVAVRPTAPIEHMIAALMDSNAGLPLLRDQWEPVVRMVVVNQTTTMTANELEPPIDKLLSLLSVCTSTGAAKRSASGLIYTTVPAIGLVNLDVLQYCVQLHQELSQLIS